MNSEGLRFLTGPEGAWWLGALTALILLIGVLVGRMIARQRADAHLRALAEANLIPADALREGMAATLEIPGRGGVHRGSGLLRRIERKIIALSVNAEELTIPVGTPMRMTLSGETAAFRFHASVLDRRLVEGVPTVYVARPLWVEKVQRRAYFRIQTEMPTTLTLCKPMEENPAMGRGIIRELSGGGLQIAVPQPYAEGALLRFRIPIESMGEPTFEARVLRCAPWQETGDHAFRVHCEFLYIPEETRNLIIQFCVETQREQMRKRRERH